MTWLNYHHLFYFWMTVQEGSVVKAAKKLRLSQPTVSAQIKLLESSLGTDLYIREGRRLVLTESGKMAAAYAEDIFRLGAEMQEILKGGQGLRPIRFSVGITDAIPKLIATRLLMPALKNKLKMTFSTREDRAEVLFASLAAHDLDLVLSDEPAVAGIKVYGKPLAQCGISFFATPKLAKKLKGTFPYSLNEQPFLVPASRSTLRRELNQWFEKKKINPIIVGECDDSALTKAIGQTGYGIFSAPSLISKEITSQHTVKLIGSTNDIKETFYAVMAERKVIHPITKIIIEAKQKLV